MRRLGWPIGHWGRGDGQEGSPGDSFILAARRLPTWAESSQTPRVHTNAPLMYAGRLRKLKGLPVVFVIVFVFVISRPVLVSRLPPAQPHSLVEFEPGH